MIPWSLVDAAPVPGGGALRLLRRGDEFVIRLDDGTELMGTRSGGSEEALARLGLAGCDGASARVLIGGLGMGFTLRAALPLLGPRARIVVVELVPAVVGWARGALAEIHAGSLDDPRVRVHVGEVGAAIRAARSLYDAILLDVDNGPDGLTRAGNGTIYDASGLGAAARALRPGGRLAIWSARPDEAFTRRLEAAGFDVTVETARGHAGRGRKHVVWVATRPQRLVSRPPSRPRGR